LLHPCSSQLKKEHVPSDLQLDEISGAARATGNPDPYEPKQTAYGLAKGIGKD
jgi:hypothetical protein